MKTVIIGGVAGGASAAARLRRLDEQAEIIMFERGEYISFANCGLPYFIGNVITDENELILQTPESFYQRFRIDVRTLSEVIVIDSQEKAVTVMDHRSGATYIESYDKLIIATGAEPASPAIPGISSPRVFTLRTIPDTMRIHDFIERHSPSHAVIAGGGYIGVEMAENLMKAGLNVTIVDPADHIIPPLDFDMAADVHQYIKSRGVDLILGSAVTEITDTQDRLIVHTDGGSIEADMVILSVGVKPESRLARDAGLEICDNGAIEVDSFMRTSDPDIYAVGDVASVTNFVTKKSAFIPLAGPANKQGRIAADNICGGLSTYPGTQGSSIVKIFDMAVATTGVNEKTAAAARLDYDKVYLYTGNHASYYPGAANLSMKVLFEKGSGKILGAQIVGFEGVDKRCDLLAAAIRLGATAKDLTKLELCYAPPFGSAKDPVNMAGFVIENVMSGKVKQFFWHDVDNLPRDGSVTLLDVRTDGERALGSIEGFIHIPLDSLREHIDKLDRSRPIYVHCHSGLRSYIACRILIGYGFDAYNLAGGYRLYQAVKREQKTPDFPCYEYISK